MSQISQTHFKNPTANVARFLKFVRPFWDIMHERVRTSSDLKKVFVVFKFMFNMLSVTGAFLMGTWPLSLAHR